MITCAWIERMDVIVNGKKQQRVIDHWIEYEAKNGCVRRHKVPFLNPGETYWHDIEGNCYIATLFVPPPSMPDDPPILTQLLIEGYDLNDIVE